MSARKKLSGRNGRTGLTAVYREGTTNRAGISKDAIKPIIVKYNTGEKPSPSVWDWTDMTVSGSPELLGFTGPREPKSKKDVHRRIYKPAGHLTISLLRVVYGKKPIENIFEPWLADMRYEHNEALRENKPWKARFIYARYMIALFNLVWLLSIRSVVKAVVQVWKLGG